MAMSVVSVACVAVAAASVAVRPAAAFGPPRGGGGVVGAAGRRAVPVPPFLSPAATCGPRCRSTARRSKRKDEEDGGGVFEDDSDLFAQLSSSSSSSSSSTSPSAPAAEEDDAAEGEASSSFSDFPSPEEDPPSSSPFDSVSLERLEELRSKSIDADAERLREEKARVEADLAEVIAAQEAIEDAKKKNKAEIVDPSGASHREFSLGYDLTLDSYVGTMGFDEVTDWDYYEVDVDEETGKPVPATRTGSRRKVTPNPLDPNQPRRTRESSGGVVRVFRGELTGRLGGAVRSRGMDPRVIIKEFSGDLGMELAYAEMRCASMVQGKLAEERGGDGAKNGEWVETAKDRYLMGQQGKTNADDANVLKLMSILSNNSKGDAPAVALLGKLNLSEFFDDSDPDLPNQWYRALKTSPPKNGATWLVYEYAGLGTLAGYARPASVRVAEMPPRRGVFGNLLPPQPLPKWRERADYVVKGILKQSIEALATLHECGIKHGSVGRGSVVLGSAGQDKNEASSPYALIPSRLRLRLTDLGFSVPLREASADDAFRNRARSYGLTILEGDDNIASRNFAVAEDLHALGFVFLGLLLTSLAELTPGSRADSLPPADEDSLQRLLGDIFEGDFDKFREYLEEERAWRNVVGLLDEKDGAGWDLLRQMCRARERAGEIGDGGEREVLLTARGLLDNPLFKR